MKKELYFLRSSEQKIVNNMLQYAYPREMKNLNVFSDFFGLTTKDLGIYTLVNNEIAGAIWSRKIDGGIPILSVAIVPKFKKQGVGIFMMEQFLQEAAAVYEQINIDISHKPKAIKFYEKFGFTKDKSSNSLIMIKKLEKKEVVRPSDGYDPRRWMD